ncbi:hypothetical protein MLD38_016699 [Melastoma candidum]|uniref:Uncharacterized protein n=1 Tax=Melastoma candidum TaxID=119954 RepID=A0ACB9QNF0_9MYRT|nr:hypothetical protein MLD38_016699 [Melastoma candidum]
MSTATTRQSWKSISDITSSDGQNPSNVVTPVGNFMTPQSTTENSKGRRTSLLPTPTLLTFASPISGSNFPLRKIKSFLCLIRTQEDSTCRGYSRTACVWSTFSSSCNLIFSGASI